ncbi:acyclic terpene utilization AtuA family protein [Lentibacillus sp. L22]|uniref:acyclic terpene utilization AtuA family protein n=1 Tax=Lentibacillus TaxID=175304 RepID=UPI0022B18ED4|nr:acyclic terpene utilization AtuA family protein [Lentibacillus daqui]
MLRIGTGAGFSGDRLEPAEILLKHADLDYLVLECLAERTIALAQQRKSHDANDGYDPLLEKRIRRLLPLLLKKGVRLITNMGAANPIAGAEKITEIADELNLPCKVAAVTGDDVVDKIDKNATDWENNRKLSSYEPIISANAYLGIDAILPALETESNIIITGRIADPSLFLAPQVYHFKWSKTDYQRLGQGTVNGHLLECAGQISGGYFADGYKKKVENLAHIGFPYAEIDSDGRSIIKKVEGTGGLIDLRTVKEQLLYEVHNPAEYITPDVIADFSSVQLKEIGKNQVEVRNGCGKKRPDLLKVSLGYHAGFLGEGEISYAGSDAVERAKIAGKILKERLSEQIPDLRIDFIGLSSVHRAQFKEKSRPYEIRVRAAGYHYLRDMAELIGEEVESLYLNGPSGGGGARKKVTEQIGVVSTFVPRDQIETMVNIKERKWKK